MDRDMKESSKKVRRTEKGSFSGLMAQFLLDNSVMIQFMGQVYTPGQIGAVFKETGNTIKSEVQEKYSTLTDKDNLSD